jgi:hypothetical protein
MVASRASSSPLSTKPPVNLFPAPFRSRHWPTVSEFPLVDVWSLYCFFSCSLSPLPPVNDSSNSLARCRSTIHYYEIEADTVHDDDFTDATAFNPPFSPSAPDLSLATAATRSCRIPSFSFSAFIFRQHRLRAQAISAQPHYPERSQQVEDCFGLNLALDLHLHLTHVSVRRTSPFLGSAVVLAAVPTTCFQRIPISPDLLPSTPYRPP